MASQYKRNEKRIHRALNRIAAQWSAAHSVNDFDGMQDADVRYCRGLHMRAKVLKIVNGGGDARVS